MAPRHRKPARLTPRARRTLLGLAMVAVLAPVAGVALGSAIGDVKDCTDEVTVDVAATPELAPVMRDYAKSWSSKAPPTKGVCVSVDVKSADSASVAAAYAKRFDADLDLGDAKLTEVAIPDVWVPESMTWPARLGGDLDGKLATGDVSSVAESHVGVAVPASEKSDETVTKWSDTAIKPADPRSDAAVLAMAMGIAADSKEAPAVAANGLPVASAAQVHAHNAKHPDKTWTFVELEPKARAFDYPFITQTDLDSELQRATDAFKAALVKNTFTDTLARYGMAKPGPYPRPVEPEKVDKAINRGWLS